MYLAPIGKDGGVYPSTSVLEQAGAIPLPGLIEEAAFTRLSLAYGTFEKDRKAARQAVLNANKRENRPQIHMHISKKPSV